MPRTLSTVQPGENLVVINFTVLIETMHKITAILNEFKARRAESWENNRQRMLLSSPTRRLFIPNVDPDITAFTRSSLMRVLLEYALEHMSSKELEKRVLASTIKRGRPSFVGLGGTPPAK